MKVFVLNADQIAALENAEPARKPRYDKTPYVDFVSALEMGVVTAIELDEDENARTVKTRLVDAARNRPTLPIDLEFLNTEKVVDGAEVLAFKVVAFDSAAHEEKLAAQKKRRDEIAEQKKNGTYVPSARGRKKNEAA